MSDSLRQADDGFYIGRHKVPADSERHIRFYLEHGPLPLPYRNERGGEMVESVEVSCDACGRVFQERDVHGTVNGYPTCVEVRLVALCVHCSAGRPRIIHNTLRFRGGRLEFLRDGRWMISGVAMADRVRAWVASWWRRLVG